MRAGALPLIALAALVLVAGCSLGGDEAADEATTVSASETVEAATELRFASQTVDGLSLPARVEGRSVEAAADDSFVPLFWAGVNLGSTVPGHQPGEVAPTREDYDRWLGEMGEFGARVVRIYTILRPGFYDALSAYNKSHPERPLFFGFRRDGIV